MESAGIPLAMPKEKSPTRNPQGCCASLIHIALNPCKLVCGRLAAVHNARPRARARAKYTPLPWTHPPAGASQGAEQPSARYPRRFTQLRYICSRSRLPAPSHPTCLLRLCESWTGAVSLLTLNPESETLTYNTLDAVLKALSP